jgi:hypothetical protein
LHKIREALEHAETVSKKLHSELTVFAPTDDRHVDGEGHTVLGEIHLQGEIGSCLHSHVALQSASCRREIEQDAC